MFQSMSNIAGIANPSEANVVNIIKKPPLFFHLLQGFWADQLILPTALSKKKLKKISNLLKDSKLIVQADCSKNSLCV